MTARHKLADVIVQVLDPDALDPVQQEVALAVADAVLGMIKPLEWRNSYVVWRAETPFGDYKVSGCILTLPLPMNPQQVHANEEAAKAAANAHHRAQILAALGITQEGRT